MAGFQPFGQIQTAQVGGRTFQFARGADNALWTNDGTGWKSQGGVLTSDPFVQNVPGGFNVFARGTTGDVYQINQGPTGWANWADIGQKAPTGASQLAPSSGVTLNPNQLLGSHILNGQTNVSLNPNNSVTSGSSPDYAFNNGYFGWNINNHAGTLLPMDRVIGRASSYMGRGLDEQSAYNLALAEEMQQLNQAGISASTYKLLPYQQGIVTSLAPYINANNYGAIQSNPTAARFFDQYYNQGGGYQTYGNPSAPGGGNPPPGGGGNPPPAGGNTPPAGGQNPPGGGGNPPGSDANFFFNQYLLQNPDAAYRYLLEQNGMNPDRVGLLGNFIKQAVLGGSGGGILGNLLQTRGLGTGNAVAGTADFVKNLGRQFFTADEGAGLQGTIGSALADVARAAPEQLSGQGIDQNQAINYLTQIAQLRSAFAPSITQNAIASMLRQGAGQYLDASLNAMNNGTQIGSFLDFLPQGIKDRIFGPGF